MGYANVAVWLADEEGDFQLGAYMKYTAAGDPPLTNAMKRAILPLATKEQFVRLTDADLVVSLTPAEQKLFKGQDILAVNCTYLGDSLAAAVFFRDARSAFTDDDAELLKAIAPIFAVALATVVRGADDEVAEDDGRAVLREGLRRAGRRTDRRADRRLGRRRPPRAPEEEGGKPKADAADWWKRGEAPPSEERKHETRSTKSERRGARAEWFTPRLFRAFFVSDFEFISDFVLRVSC